MNYTEVYRHESHGERSFGLKILMAVGRELGDAEKSLLHRVAEQIIDEATAETIRLDPKARQHALDEREKLLACFGSPFRVEEIPNGYCSRGCCRHLPWFVVQTLRGPIQIGWRKRVISIDWSASDVAETAQDLFPDENSTKEGRMIHAWGYEKASAYVQRLLGGLC